MLFVCVQHSSSTIDDNDVLALFDDIASYLDAQPVEVQVSPESLTTQFSAKEVEDRSTIARLLKSSVCSIVNDNLIDKVERAIKILSVEHRMPSPVAEFLQLPDKLDTLYDCNILLKSDKGLQIAWSKTREKSLQEAKMREHLPR